MADFICEKLRRYSELYPRIKFVFNSILNVDFANDRWCNEAINLVNESVFRITAGSRNIVFFDSHEVYMHDTFDFDVIDGRHGIHITQAAKFYLCPVVVNCIMDLLTDSLFTSRHWPLRPRFRNLLSPVH